MAILTLSARVMVAGTLPIIAAISFWLWPAERPRLPAGLRVKGASIKHQGFRSWTSRKPRLLSRADGEPLPR